MGGEVTKMVEVVRCREHEITRGRRFRPPNADIMCNALNISRGLV